MNVSNRQYFTICLGNGLVPSVNNIIDDTIGLHAEMM